MINDVALLQKEIRSLELFKSMIKTGCQWHGDTFSKKWSEVLYFEDNIRDDVLYWLSSYTEGVDYKLDGNSVWIC